MADATNTSTTSTTTPDTSGQTTTVQTADQIAQSMGYADAQTLLTQLKDAVANGGAGSSIANDTASEFAKKLFLLVLEQRIDSDYNLKNYRWINKFELVKMEAGNTKQFIRQIITGAESYEKNKFVPSEISDPLGDTTTISLYADKNETLTTYGYKYKKPVVVMRNEWVPYFISGKLQVFIDGLVKMANESYQLFKFQMIQNMIGDLKTNIANKITGTATNILTSFTNEIYPEIVNMGFLNSKYNINMNGTATSLNSSNPEDLLILMNNKVYTRLNSGVLAQVYNNKLASVEEYINKENITPCAQKIVVGDSKTPISVSTDDLISENEIIVMNKESIKGIYWVEQAEQQSWAENMTVSFVFHIWGAYGFIPWGQGFYYTNPNLSVMPN